MPSSRLAVAACLLVAAAAQAQTMPPPARGFAVERFYPSAPGGGWFVLDALDFDSRLGGAAAVTGWYASNPLRVHDGSERLAAVSDMAVADFAFALTWRRLRVSLDLDVPLAIIGQNGNAAGLAYTAPGVDPASRPDDIFDPRIGLDVRLVATARFRLAAGAQLIIPNGGRDDYVTDSTVRGTFRLMAAGDFRWLTWAAHAGVHLRPLDELLPDGPRGPELLFAAAAGARFAVRRLLIVVGPEFFGATAVRGSFADETTAFEGLLSGRIEGAGRVLHWRARLGVGAGLHARFGAPEWRLVAGVELFGSARR